MSRNSRTFLAVTLLALTALTLCNPSASAQTVWSGLTKTFTKPSFTDYTLPQYQDPLTPNVVLTRGDIGGLINIKAESSFVMSVSPKLTTWATDINNPGETIAATNFANLSFTNWLDAYGGAGTGGASIAGRNAVVYLTDDNVYLDLKFTSWTPSLLERSLKPLTAVSPPKLSNISTNCTLPSVFEKTSFTFQR